LFGSPVFVGGAEESVVASRFTPKYVSVSQLLEPMYSQALLECLNSSKDAGDTDVFSLEPLRKRGPTALDCFDIPELKSVRLIHLQYRHAGGNQHRVTHQADDVFVGLRDIGESIPEGVQLVCMGIRLTVVEPSKRDYFVQLRKPNLLIYDDDCDVTLAHRFLSKRGFILESGGHT
jgi:hypothetical protein